MPIRINLFGKHSCRTPLAYKTYQKTLRGKIEIVSDPLEADLLVTGFSKDFCDSAGLLENIMQIRPDLKLAVISEEPLWDSIYSLHYQDTIKSNKCKLLKAGGLQFSFFAHHNSDIFNYNTIPYFITTDLSLPIRYLSLISSWLSLPWPKRNEYYMNRDIRQFLLLAERREDSWFEYIDDEAGIEGLCILRSSIGMRLIDKEGIDIIGKGFTPNHEARQSLGDWHLDKLSRSYGAYSIVSAIENTHTKNYVTEKIFDAFACHSAPLYYAGEDHSVFTNLSLTSLLNIRGLDLEHIIYAIESFTWNSDAIEKYENDANHILDLLNPWDSVVDDISSRSDKILRAVEASLGD